MEALELAAQHLGATEVVKLDYKPNPNPNPNLATMVFHLYGLRASGTVGASGSSAVLEN